MIADAHIVVTEIYDTRGNPERVEWDWQGGKIAAISLNRDFPRPHLASALEASREGDVFSLGPFRLLVIDYDSMRDQILVMQTGRMPWLRLYIHKAICGMDLAYRRFVVSMSVWGLAKYNPARIPTWRDIYFLGKLFGEEDTFLDVVERINVSLKDERTNNG